jgi:hypothetical protein
MSSATVRRRGRKGDFMGSFLKELWAFMRERKKFWLLPIILVLLLFGTLLVLTEGTAVAPFIYTLF